MAKITLGDVAALNGAGINTINANAALIEAAFENTLSRDGTDPNQMLSNLDMNSHRITNLPTAVNSTEPVTLGQAASILATNEVLTQASLGAYLWPRTAEEVTAGVTPTYYYYEPGDVRRYGAVGDGVTNDSAAIQAAVDANSDVYLASQTLLCDRIDVDTTTVIRGPGKLVCNGVGTISTSQGLLNVTANDSLVDGVEIDMNDKGRTAIFLGGDRCVASGCNIYDILGDTGSGNTASAIHITGDYCSELNNRTRNCLTGTATNPNVPRAVTIDTSAAYALSRGHRSTDCAGFCIIGLSSFATIEDFHANVTSWVSEKSRNGIYVVEGATDVTVRGGLFRDCNQTVVVANSSRCTFRDMHVIDWRGGCLLIENATDCVFDNITALQTADYTTETYAATTFCSTRSANTTSTDITIRNCYAEMYLKDVSILSFYNSGGTLYGIVNGLVVEGNVFRTRHTANSTTTRNLVKHDSGDSVFYRDNTIYVVDEDTTPLTGSDYFTLQLPASLTKSSVWDNNVLQKVDGGSYELRVFNAIQANLYVRHGYSRANSGPYLLTDQSGRKRVTEMLTAPAVGTWAVGDLVFNTAPTAGGTIGWVCTTAGTPGTWKTFGAITA